MRKLLEKLSPRTPKKDNPQDALQYWRERVTAYGKRSVFNIAHTDEELERITEMQKDEIYPCFRKLLNGHERIVLDFGCGFGRFTGDLALMINGEAVGIDPVPDLIRWAPPHKGVTYRVTGDGSVSLPENYVDVVWVCLVLGGLKGFAIEKAVEEIDRVLKAGGLLFVVENTSAKNNAAHWTFRQFKEYRALLPFVTLEHLHDYFDVDERISVMAGRRPL